MSGRLSCKRRAVDSATSLIEDLASQDLDITDDFCEPSVAFRAPKRPKYSRKAADKSSKPSRSLSTVSSSLPSKSFSGSDKENVDGKPEKSSEPMAVVYTIDDDDDVSLSPAKQATTLVCGAGKLKVNSNVQKSSRSCKELLSNRLTRSLPSGLSNEDIERDVPDSIPTSDGACGASSQVPCTTQLQDSSTSKYFRTTRSRAAVSQKANLPSTENRSSPTVAPDSPQAAQASTVVCESNGLEDDFIGLPSTADDPELADIEKSICAIDERLCPCCKHIVASANYGAHLSQCFKQFQFHNRLKTGSSSESTRQSRNQANTNGGVDAGSSNVNAITTEPPTGTGRSSSAGHCVVAGDSQHRNVAVNSADGARSFRILSGTSGGVLQFDGDDKTEQNLLLKPLQNQSCMVRVRRNGAARGDPPATRRGRRKKTTSLTTLQTTCSRQRSDFLLRRLEKIKTWRPDNAGEFEQITRGSKKRGRQRVCEAVSLYVAKDRPLWSLTSQEHQDVSSYYVTELAPHVVPPLQGNAAILTLHRALSQIPGRLNVTRNMNLDSDDEDYPHPLDCQDSFMSSSLGETQRVLADLLRSQASLFHDATTHDIDSPRTLLQPAAGTPGKRLPVTVDGSKSLVKVCDKSLKKCAIVLKRTPIKKVYLCESESANDSQKTGSLVNFKTTNRKDLLHSCCGVDVVDDSPGAEDHETSLACDNAMRHQEDSVNVLSTCSYAEQSKKEVSVSCSNFDNARRISVSPDILRTLKPIRIELTRLTDATSGLQIYSQTRTAVTKKSEIPNVLLDDKDSQVCYVDVPSQTESTAIEKYDFDARRVKLMKETKSDHEVISKKHVNHDDSSSLNPAIIASDVVDDGDESTLSFDIHEQQHCDKTPTKSFEDSFLDPDDCSKAVDGVINKHLETMSVDCSGDRVNFTRHNITPVFEKHSDAGNKNNFGEKQNISPTKTELLDENSGSSLTALFNVGNSRCCNTMENKNPKVLSDREVENSLRKSRNPIDDEALETMKDDNEVQPLKCEALKTGAKSESLHSSITELFDNNANDSLSVQCAPKVRKAVVPLHPDLSWSSPNMPSRLNSRYSIFDRIRSSDDSSTCDSTYKGHVTPLRDTSTKPSFHVRKLPNVTEMSQHKTWNPCWKPIRNQTAGEVSTARERKHPFSRNITTVPASDASDDDVLPPFISNSKVTNKLKERTLSNFSVANVSKLNSFLNDSDIITVKFRDLNLQRYFSSLPKDGFDEITLSFPEGSAVELNVHELPALESGMKRKVNEDFRNLLETGAVTDATIIPYSGSIPVHSLVLFVRCPTLYDELKAASKSKSELKWGVSFASAKQFLTYIYGGTFEIECTYADYREIYDLSTKYKCDDLCNYLLKSYPDLSIPKQNSIKTILHGKRELTVVSPSPEIESAVSSAVLKTNYDLQHKRVNRFKVFEENASHDAIDENTKKISLPSLNNEKCSNNCVSNLESSTLFRNYTEPVEESESQCVINPSLTPSPVSIDAGNFVQDFQLNRSIPGKVSTEWTCVKANTKLNVDICTEAISLKHIFDSDVLAPSKNRSRSPDLFDDLADDFRGTPGSQADIDSQSKGNIHPKLLQTKPAVDLRSVNDENSGDAIPANSNLTLYSKRQDVVNQREVIDITQSDSDRSQQSKKSHSIYPSAVVPSACNKSSDNEISLPSVSPKLNDTKTSETKTSFSNRYKQFTDIEHASKRRVASAYLSNVWDDFEGGDGFEMEDIPLTPEKLLSESSSSKVDSRKTTNSKYVDCQPFQDNTKRDPQVHLGLNSTAIDDKNDKSPNFPDVSIVPAFIDSMKSLEHSSTFPSSAKRRLCNETPEKYNDLDVYDDNDSDLWRKIEVDALESTTSKSTRLVQRIEKGESYATCYSELSSRKNEERLKLASETNFTNENGVNATEGLSGNPSTGDASTQIKENSNRRKKPFTFKTPEGSNASSNKCSSRAAGAALSTAFHQRVNKLRQSPSSRCATTPQSTGTPITPRPDYSIMASPELKKALDDFGVRPLARAKARALLKHIYEQTHPVVGTSNKSRDVDAFTPVGRSHAGAHRVKKGSRAQVGAPEESHAASPSREGSSLPQVVDLSLLDDVEKGCAEESMLLSQNNSGGDADSPQEKGSIHEQLRFLISSERSLYEAVLLYQPVWLHHIKQLTVAAGIKCSMATLVDFLDQQCITFRMGAPGQGSGSRTRRKPKKRKLPIQI
ncbi:BTB/POZ domain [Trinorchestia longiramus]|nr:BTB/POZ domain [Trinorchestia longiramus]